MRNQEKRLKKLRDRFKEKIKIRKTEFLESSVFLLYLKGNSFLKFREIDK